MSVFDEGLATIMRRSPRHLEAVEGEDSRGADLDARVAERLMDFSQSVSRRGMFARVGKFALTAVGATVAAQLFPMGTAQADGSTNWGTCSGWDKCNMCGHKCDCCNGSLGEDRCPSCTTTNNYWVGCCRFTTGERVRVEYWDCMDYNNNCASGKRSECHSCNACGNGCPEKVWSYPQDFSKYFCTKVKVGGTC